METYQQLLEENAKLKAQLADVLAEGGSYRRLQVELDETLESRKSERLLHRQEIEGLARQHAAHVERLADEHAAALAALCDGLQKNHAAEIAALKQQVLVPALRDLHARQAADLAAKHQAELEQLA